MGVVHLTYEQKHVLTEVAREPLTATAQLVRLSDAWNVEFNVLARAYAGMSGSIRPMSPDRDAQAMVSRNQPAAPQFSSEEVNNLSAVLRHRSRGVRVLPLQRPI